MEPIDFGSPENVVSLPVRKKPQADSPITVAPSYGGCRHMKTVVDEKLAEVTCRDCGEKLSPVWVLAKLAREDDRLRNEWAAIRAEIELLKDRSRVVCKHCNKVTPVRMNASDHKRLVLREEIRKADRSKAHDRT